MLPAISSDLPAYLQPPKVGEENRRTSSDEFGPAAEVELSEDKAVSSQSSQPGTGIYGPDGRFVESAARREVQDQPRSSNEAGPPRTEDSADAIGAAPKAADQDADAAPADAQLGSAPEMLSPAESTPARDRELALANFDTIIPPAAREELKALADHVSRAAAQRQLDRDQYHEMADLMSRLGRHPDAARARAEAQSMEQSGSGEEADQSQSVLSQLVQA